MSHCFSSPDDYRRALYSILSYIGTRKTGPACIPTGTFYTGGCSEHLPTVEEVTAGKRNIMSGVFAPKKYTLTLNACVVYKPT